MPENPVFFDAFALVHYVVRQIGLELLLLCRIDAAHWAANLVFTKEAWVKARLVAVKFQRSNFKRHGSGIQRCELRAGLKKGGIGGCGGVAE